MLALVVKSKRNKFFLRSRMLAKHVVLRGHSTAPVPRAHCSALFHPLRSLQQSLHAEQEFPAIQLLQRSGGPECRSGVSELGGEPEVLAAC